MGIAEEASTTLRSQVEALVASGDIGEASQLVANALDTEPPALLIWAARALEGAGAVEAARLAYEAAVRRSPDYWLGHQSLGALLLHQGELLDAIDSLTRANRLRPGPIPLTYLGFAHSRLGNDKQAIAAYREALTLDKDHEEAAFNLGAKLADSDPSEAISLFREALRVDPDYGLAHRELGWMLLRRRRKADPEKAEYHLRRAIELLPDDYWCNLYVGHWHHNHGRRTQALQHYERASAAEPEEPLPFQFMADAYHDRHEWEQAIELCEHALELEPEDPNARRRLARSLAASGNLPEARLQLEKALSIDPDNESALRLLSRINSPEEADRAADPDGESVGPTD